MRKFRKFLAAGILAAVVFMSAVVFLLTPDNTASALAGNYLFTAGGNGTVTTTADGITLTTSIADRSAGASEQYTYFKTVKGSNFSVTLKLTKDELEVGDEISLIFDDVTVNFKCAATAGQITAVSLSQGGSEVSADSGTWAGIDADITVEVEVDGTAVTVSGGGDITYTIDELDEYVGFMVEHTAPSGGSAVSAVINTVITELCGYDVTFPSGHGGAFGVTDVIAPELTVTPDTATVLTYTGTSDVTFTVKAYDLFTTPEHITIKIEEYFGGTLIAVTTQQLSALDDFSVDSGTFKYEPYANKAAIINKFGEHTITITAIDASGNVAATQSRAVTVTNPKNDSGTGSFTDVTPVITIPSVLTDLASTADYLTGFTLNTDITAKDIFGADIDVGVDTGTITAKVIAPNGTVTALTGSTGAYTFNQLGDYVFVFTATDIYGNTERTNKTVTCARNTPAAADENTDTAAQDDITAITAVRNWGAASTLPAGGNLFTNVYTGDTITVEVKKGGVHYSTGTSFTPAGSTPAGTLLDASGGGDYTYRVTYTLTGLGIAQPVVRTFNIPVQKVFTDPPIITVAATAEFPAGTDTRYVIYSGTPTVNIPAATATDAAGDAVAVTIEINGTGFSGGIYPIPAFGNYIVTYTATFTNAGGTQTSTVYRYIKCRTESPVLTIPTALPANGTTKEYQTDSFTLNADITATDIFGAGIDVGVDTGTITAKVISPNGTETALSSSTGTYRFTEIGNYVFVFTATDTYGYTVSENRTVTCTRTVTPGNASGGSADTDIAAIGSVKDWGAPYTLPAGGNLFTNIYTGDTITVEVKKGTAAYSTGTSFTATGSTPAGTSLGGVGLPFTYTVTYTLTARGLSGTYTRTFDIPVRKNFTDPPIITLTTTASFPAGQDTYTVVYSGGSAPTVTLPTASAADITGDTVTVSMSPLNSALVLTSGSTYNITAPGTYTVTYTASVSTAAAGGPFTATVTRYVICKTQSAPSLNISSSSLFTGGFAVTHGSDNKFTLPGFAPAAVLNGTLAYKNITAKAPDGSEVYNGDGTALPEVTVDAVTKLGVYTVVYTARDGDGNTASETKTIRAYESAPSGSAAFKTGFNGTVEAILDTCVLTSKFDVVVTSTFNDKTANFKIYYENGSVVIAQGAYSDGSFVIDKVNYNSTGTTVNSNGKIWIQFYTVGGEGNIVNIGARLEIKSVDTRAPSVNKTSEREFPDTVTVTDRSAEQASFIIPKPDVYDRVDGVNCTISVTVKNPAGTTVVPSTPWTENFRRPIAARGEYTVTYTVKDQSGNTAELIYKFKVITPVEFDAAGFTAAYEGTAEAWKDFNHWQVPPGGGGKISSFGTNDKPIPTVTAKDIFGAAVTVAVAGTLYGVSGIAPWEEIISVAGGYVFRFGESGTYAIRFYIADGGADELAFNFYVYDQERMPQFEEYVFNNGSPVSVVLFPVNFVPNQRGATLYSVPVSGEGGRFSLTVSLPVWRWNGANNPSGGSYGVRVDYLGQEVGEVDTSNGAAKVTVRNTGFYTVTYTIYFELLGIAGKSISYRFEVRDETKPVVNAEGFEASLPKNIVMNVPVTLSFPKASDNYDTVSDLVWTVEVRGPENFYSDITSSSDNPAEVRFTPPTAGTYTLSYTVRDAAGNEEVFTQNISVKKSVPQPSPIFPIALGSLLGLAILGGVLYILRVKNILKF